MTYSWSTSKAETPANPNKETLLNHQQVKQHSLNGQRHRPAAYLTTTLLTLRLARNTSRRRPRLTGICGILSHPSCQRGQKICFGVYWRLLSTFDSCRRFKSINRHECGKEMALPLSAAPGDLEAFYYWSVQSPSFTIIILSYSGCRRQEQMHRMMPFVLETYWKLLPQKPSPACPSSAPFCWRSESVCSERMDAHTSTLTFGC